MAEIKLVFFDMEGTIFRKVLRNSYGNTAPSAWSLIARHLGSQAYLEEEDTKRKWTRGEYNGGYIEWMEDTLSIYKKYGLNRKCFYDIIEGIEYHRGVFKTFSELRARGYRTALISGGFKAQADRAKKDLGIDYVFSACELLFDKSGMISGWNLIPSDYEGKVDFMRHVMEEHGISKSECAFVGDGVNDVCLAREAGISISFNGAHELEKVATHAIRQKEGKEDFTKVLGFL